MYCLGAIVLGVCFLNSQAQSTTTVAATTVATTTTAAITTAPATTKKDTTTTKAPTTTAATTKAATTTTKATDYLMTYAFEFYGDDGTATRKQVTTAVKVAVTAIGVDEAKVLPLDSLDVAPARIGDKIVYAVKVKISFPLTYSMDDAEVALKSRAFSEDLQDGMRKQGLGGATVTFARVAGPDGKGMPAAIPGGPDAGPPSCGKSSLTGGLLTFFFGGFGVGRFYYGYIGLGAGWLVWTLLAHIGTPVGSCLTKAGSGNAGCMIAGAILVGLCGISEICLFAWWIHDLIVMFNQSLKPFGNDGCVFDS